MEELTWKIDLRAKCPYCGEEDTYIFYLNAETINCNKCHENFHIELWFDNIEVRTSKQL